MISDTSDNPANVVLGHELMHRVKAKNPSDFKKLQDIFTKELKGKKFADYAQEMKSVGKDLGEEYSNDDIMEEMTADFSGEMFNNPKIMQRIFEDDRSLAKRIYDIISDMIVSLRKPLSRAYIVSDSIKNLKKVEDEYVALIQKARKNDGLSGNGADKFSLKKDKDWSSPEFKKGARKFLDGNPVVTLKGDEFQKIDGSEGNDLVTRVEAYYQLKYKGRVTNPEIGEVRLNRRGIKDSMSHGIGKIKAAAFKAAPDIIEKGKVIDYKNNWKGKHYDTYVISAPVKIADDDYIGAVVVINNDAGSRFYVHEVFLKKKLEIPFKTGTNINDASVPGGNQVSIQSILSDIFNVNSEDPKC